MLYNREPLSLRSANASKLTDFALTVGLHKLKKKENIFNNNPVTENIFQ